MVSGKAISVIKTFSNEELKRFGEFLNSPFHNKNKNLIKLYDLLKSFHPLFETDNLTLHSIVYPERPFNNDNFKKMMSELLSASENFLIVTGLEKKNFQNQFTLLNELQIRNLDNIFSLYLKKTEQEIRSYKLYATYSERAFLQDLKIKFYQSRDIGFKEIEYFKSKLDCDMVNFFDSVFAELQSVEFYKKNYNDKYVKSFSDLFIKNFKIDSFIKSS
ncbi:MAG: hypothetical protein ABI462_00850 [Ignavibacteria bacterium]